jgi:hypothetical protein
MTFAYSRCPIDHAHRHRTLAIIDAGAELAVAVITTTAHLLVTAAPRDP